MIDFDALVLGPAMAVFARPITVYPDKSQAGRPSYTARGVFSTKPVDVQTEDGAIISTQEHRLGLRVSEFSVVPRQGDRILIDAYLSAPRIGMCLVEDGRDEDGQGGKDLTLKVIGP